MRNMIIDKKRRIRIDTTLVDNSLCETFTTQREVAKHFLHTTLFEECVLLLETKSSVKTHGEYFLLCWNNQYTATVKRVELYMQYVSNNKLTFTTTVHVNQ